MRSTTTRLLTVALLAASGLVAGAGASHAHDHLANAATSPGASSRGFANPVAGNPSGMSGSASSPGTVPGLGDPKSGGQLGTPAFDCATLALRLAARSEGTGPACD